MATLPNSREDLERSDAINFDGGKKITATGVTAYDFSDGTRAIYGTGRDFELTIYFAASEKVSIKAAPKLCKICGREFWPGEVKKYCNQCGAKQ